MPPASQTRPRCVVLPIPSQDSLLPFIGMAVHFLFGNLVVLHPGFTECWFGWRVAKIFPDAADLEAYWKTGQPAPDLIRTGRREQIRFWITGAVSSGPESPAVRIDTTEITPDEATQLIMLLRPQKGFI